MLRTVGIGPFAGRFPKCPSRPTRSGWSADSFSVHFHPFELLFFYFVLSSLVSFFSTFIFAISFPYLFVLFPSSSLNKKVSRNCDSLHNYKAQIMNCWSRCLLTVCLYSICPSFTIVVSFSFNIHRGGQWKPWVIEARKEDVALRYASVL